jgi:methylase of polypeptide subunit release factors
MDIVATLVGQAISQLRHQGYLMFEFGFGQEVAVEELIEKTEGLTLIGLRRDLHGIARTAIARRT